MSTFEERPSIRSANPLPISIVATLAANAQTIHPLPANRTGIVRKMAIYNGNAAQTVVHFGTGVGGAFVEVLPPVVVPAGMDVELTEDMIPAVEFTASITAWASAAAAAPADVRITLEVEHLLGTSG